MLDGVNGLLVDSDPGALADAIHRLLTDGDLYAKVSMNNVATSRRYTWGAVVGKRNIEQQWPPCLQREAGAHPADKQGQGNEVERPK
jgi:hypothetical protein